jgi:hypothetical protein
VLAAAATLAALAICGALFIESGYYDIGADDHHTKWVLAIIERLRERSIEVRARTIQVPMLEDPRRIGAGAQRAFWIVKHGIKMSAMPAWSRTLDDVSIWNVVAFIRKMPAMTPETYRELSRENSG